jgi:inositol-phosphate phosphatase / L-galactose 1-phosphate phosphatase / histidinol-phosphatase
MDEALALRRDLALELADLAGEIARAGFRRVGRVEQKADGTLVSDVDRAIEARLREALVARFPDDGVVGEEYGVERAGARWSWVIDPIDGTRAFLAGMPTFVTLIGALEEGRARLGVIEQPIVGDRWVGVDGAGTHFAGARVQTRSPGGLGTALLATTDPFLFPADERPKLETLSRRTRARVTGGDGMLYGLLASGHVDLVVESGLAWHDVAALIPVVRGAGGWIGGWDGAELTPERCSHALAAADAELAAAARAVLAEP